MEEDYDKGMEGASLPYFCLQFLYRFYVHGSLVLTKW